MQQTTKVQTLGPLERVAVILPSLNPDQRMPQTVRGMLQAGFSHVLVVDDGSDPDHKEPFEEVKALPGVELLVHPVNLGKGQALKDAFTYVLEKMPGMDGCVTVDGDAQHSPEDTVACALKMLETGHITLGCRNFDDPAVPKRNATGNKITRWVFQKLVGLPVSDTQTGLRAFPRAILPTLLETEGQRFEYESNMLLDMKDKAIPFEEVTIRTIYINGNETSHFHPVIDSYKVYKPILKRAKPIRFAASSLASSVVDIGLFTLINGLLRLSGAVGDSLRILISTGGARICSGLFNYLVNRRAVFRSSERTGRSLPRYAAVSIVQFAASYFGTHLLTNEMFHTGGFGDTCCKALVDVCLFFLSYQVQKKWVFGRQNKEQ